MTSSHHALEDAIEHAAHLVPSQGPIEVFVHHNTLHAFEDLSFAEALKKGAADYQCECYLSEDRYREELQQGRILREDLTAVLSDDLRDEADVLIGGLGPRFHLRLAMLEHPLLSGPDAELHWQVSETRALGRFRREATSATRLHWINETRDWVLSETRESRSASRLPLIENLVREMDNPVPQTWSESDWESFTLQLLWRICHQGVHGIRRLDGSGTALVRPRDLLLKATARDSDLLVHDVLIRFCAAYLDQGFAPWNLPDRSAGFFAAFQTVFGGSFQSEEWLSELPGELRRIQLAGLSPVESIAESVSMFGITSAELEAFITQTALALRGWAGMLWQMETNAEWTVRPAPAGSLQEFLAVRLVLDRLAVRHLYRQEFGDDCPLDELRHVLHSHLAREPRTSVDQRAFAVFQLAQIRRWSPRELQQMGKDGWTLLLREIETFNSWERRRIFQLAYERRYRIRTLDALAIHAAATNAAPPQNSLDRPTYQIVTCIDDREESFRRHLEEIAPSGETYAAAGFFAVAMYFRGADEAHYRPLCPVVIKPKHFVVEEVAYSLAASSRQREEARKLLGQATHRWHLGSRSLLGGILTSVLGSFASIPLITRILFPRLTAQANRLFGSFFQPPAITELQLYRQEPQPGPAPDQRGYSLDEMADIVARILQDIGLTSRFSRIIIFAGHGSGSLNNPHESAYNCGACSGGRGGPNARAFAQMANNPIVRQRLIERGLAIPSDTVFVGAFHNTCDEDVVYYDLDDLPRSHRSQFEVIRGWIDEARARNAHERCRRFESASLKLTPAAALAHVEERAEDLSQARPEYNHATNALCFVGRRQWSRGLFADRRVFLASYDPAQDDDQGTILARILAAAVPVCAGISLEYYFSCVDPTGLGCGSKLPHNITAMLGVMEGAASDLRTGLSQQMIEIHEPMRILFVIETTPAIMLGIMAANSIINTLVRNEWVQLATFDPASTQIRLFQGGAFQKYQPETNRLPAVRSSFDWYGGQRDHLGFARIIDHQTGSATRDATPSVDPAVPARAEDAA